MFHRRSTLDTPLAVAMPSQPPDPRPSLLALVDDIPAPVLRPATFRRLVAAWLLFPKAHGLDLVRLSPQDLHHLLHRIGTALAEREIVFAAAAIVRVALDAHLHGAMLLQETGM